MILLMHKCPSCVLHDVCQRQFGTPASVGGNDTSRMHAAPATTRLITRIARLPLASEKTKIVSEASPVHDDAIDLQYAPAHSYHYAPRSSGMTIPFRHLPQHRQCGLKSCIPLRFFDINRKNIQPVKYHQERR